MATIFSAACPGNYSNVPHGGPTKIAFLGDSITQGYTPALPGPTFTFTTGFRQYVWAAMTAAGMNPAALGYIQDSYFSVSNTLAGGWENGLSGTNFGDWLPVSMGGAGSNYFQGTVQPAIVAQGVPNIVVYMLAANANNSDAAAAGTMQVADLIAAAWPLANLIVCSRTPKTSEASDAVNAGILSRVLARQALGKHMSFFDVFPLIDTSTADLGDGLHPTALGYAKIGKALGAAVVDLAR
jgi:lysophospholipase L1-like esterase